MKKLAVFLALSPLSGLALAQSSVTVFGVVDAAVRNVKNGGTSVTSLTSGALSSSRFGFRGIEDLGDGLKVGFWLEAAVAADTGDIGDAAGRSFSRRATVSLSGSVGEIRLGRDFTPTYLTYSIYDPFGDNGVGASSKFNSSFGTARDTSVRADKQIMYFLPSGLGGVYGSASFVPRETAAGKRYTGGRVGYTSGPFDISAAYGQTTVAPLQGEDKFKEAEVGAAYNAGFAKIMVSYEQSRFVSQKLSRYGIGAVAPVGVGQIRVMYTHANAAGTTGTRVNVDANDADQIALGYVHNLSTRTALYGTFAYVKNKGRAAFAVAATTPALVAGTRSSGLEFGLRHSF